MGKGKQENAHCVGGRKWEAVPSIFPLPSAQGDVLGVLAVAGTPCSHPEPSKGLRQRCRSGSAPDLKGSLCGPAVAWSFQEGQALNQCSSFILCVVFPDKDDVACKYLCSHVLGD